MSHVCACVASPTNRGFTCWSPARFGALALGFGRAVIGRHSCFSSLLFAPVPEQRHGKICRPPKGGSRAYRPKSLDLVPDQGVIVAV
ncbi:hypothetical protein L249_8564 [Ophiocordyceps polyrhachis-furcata BCC 54312]|uniref:Uncharacterized protein n=1 Tax=Ophiocordyceps polyrhachis-furcata BCC 54312 TaxID=1330021 RepID=A0A367L6I7_9HYPO|nr:hypothetical protein L249_8564 [Ophiocordyceps polyrhachis-furcata BCC 54312]